MGGNRWIFCANYVLFWMRRDPSIRNEYGNTLAMYWIMIFGTDPPEWMRYDPKIQNDYGYTLAKIWIMNVQTEPPEWMK